ncbi:MAG: biopolymer transporter ExbD, partial [Elusimicrobia bacterium]|nr:biopolymer transporter ExbD [Elusimicrobiota bacterium]
LVQHQLTVRLPASTQSAAADAQTAVAVEIDARGHITIDGRPVRLAALESELALKLGRASSRTVLVQADRTVPVETVVQVLDVAKKLGVGKLGLGVQPKAEP